MIVALVVTLSLAYSLPIRLPTGNGATRMGVQLAVPVIGVLVWIGCALYAHRRTSLLRSLIALACYTIVMVAHFNLKLWVPYVHTASYDPVLWQTDQFVRPIVDLSMGLRRGLQPYLSGWNEMYLWSFLTMFFFSFSYHAARSPEQFRKLFLSALFLQGLGAIGYLLVPAIGPFIYEAGVSPAMTQAQHDMLVVREAAVAMGPNWIALNGSQNIFSGLGAVPSLHAGCSYLFLWFAWRHGKVLLPTYIPIFAYILVTAVASRWHYLIDLPIGIALARWSIYLAYRFDASEDGTAPAPVTDERITPVGPELIPVRATVARSV
jgi:hypothetical protein